MATPVEIYDVTTYPGFIFVETPTIGLNACDYDPVTNLLFLGARDFVGASSTSHSHFKVWEVDPSSGNLTLLQTIPYPLNPAYSSAGFAGPQGMLYYQGVLYVVQGLGFESYSVDPTTGNLTLLKSTEVAFGGFQRMNQGVIMNTSGGSYIVGGNGVGGSSMYVFPIFPDTEHGDPIIQSFSIGDSWCTKFDDTYFYACSSDGTQLRRFSINASGTVTQLESYATGLSSAGGDTPPKISPVLYNGNVYVGGTPATGASAFFPITGSQGQLGTRVDGAISFLNNFDYQLNGPSRSTTSKQYVPFQAGAFFIPDIFNGTNQFFWFIANITPPATATGKFVGSAVYKAIEINRIGGIIPRIWPSKKNITVMA